MGLCLEADYKPPALEWPPEIIAFTRQAPKKSLKQYGLAPSPLRAHPSVYTVSSFFAMNNPG